MLFAFDLLRVDGLDLRPMPLEERRARLRTTLRRARLSLRVVEHLDGDGEAIFRHACELGLEGIVSKRRDTRYRSGRTLTWLKIKNPVTSGDDRGALPRCQHWRSDEDNPEAVEREFQMRFGPEVALVGICGHSEHRRQVTRRWVGSCS